MSENGVGHQLISYDSKNMQLVNGAGRRHYSGQQTKPTSLFGSEAPSAPGFQKRQYDNQADSKIFTPETPGRRVSRQKESDYPSHYQQMQQTKMQHQMESSMDKRSTLAELSSYNPWGKPGGGAPNTLQQPIPSINVSRRKPNEMETSNNEYGAPEYPGFGTAFGNGDRRASGDRTHINSNNGYGDSNGKQHDYGRPSDDSGYHPFGTAGGGAPNRSSGRVAEDQQEEVMKALAAKQYAQELDREMMDKRRMSQKEKDADRSTSYGTMADQMFQGKARWDNERSTHGNNLLRQLSQEQIASSHVAAQAYTAAQRPSSKTESQFSSMADLIGQSKSKNPPRGRRGSFSGSQDGYGPPSESASSVKGRFHSQDRLGFNDFPDDARPSQRIPGPNQKPPLPKPRYDDLMPLGGPDSNTNNRGGEESGLEAAHYAEQCERFRREQARYAQEYEQLQDQYQSIQGGRPREGEGVDDLAREAEERYRMRQIEKMREQHYEPPREPEVYNDYNSRRPGGNYSNGHGDTGSSNSGLPRSQSGSVGGSASYYNGYANEGEAGGDQRSAQNGDPSRFRKGKLEEKLYPSEDRSMGMPGMNSRTNSGASRPPMAPSRHPIHRKNSSSHTNNYQLTNDAQANGRIPAAAMRVTAPYAMHD